MTNAVTGQIVNSSSNPTSLSAADQLTKTSVVGGAVVAGGTNYAISDTITLSGGTSSVPTVLLVTAITGANAVSAVSIQTSGTYTVLPNNPVSQGSTSGSGSGATFNLAYTSQATLTIDRNWSLGAAATLGAKAIWGTGGIVALDGFNLTTSAVSGPLVRLFDASSGGRAIYPGVYEGAHWGQVANAQSDDSGPLNQAIAALRSAGGRKVRFMGGISIVNSTVTLQSQSLCEGDGFIQSYVRQTSGFNFDIVSTVAFDTNSILRSGSPGGGFPTRFGVRDLKIQSTATGLTTDATGHGIGLSMYGYSILCENVSINQAASIGWYCEYQGVGPVSLSDWQDGYSPTIRALRVDGCYGGGIVYRGPNDAQFSQIVSSLNGVRATVIITSGGSGFTPSSSQAVSFSNGGTGTATVNSGGVVTAIAVNTLGSQAYPITISSIAGGGSGVTTTIPNWSIEGTNVWQTGAGMRCETNTGPTYVAACQITNGHIFGNSGLGFYSNSWIHMDNFEIESSDGALAIFASQNNSTTTQQSKLTNVSFYYPNTQNYSSITAITLSGSKHTWDNVSLRADNPSVSGTPADMTGLLISGLYNTVVNYAHDSSFNSTRNNTAVSITGNFNKLSGQFLNDNNASSTALSLGNIQGFDIDASIINFSNGINFTSSSASSGRLRVRGNINQSPTTGQVMFAGTAPNALLSVHCDVEYKDNSVNKANKALIAIPGIDLTTISTQIFTSVAHNCPWTPVAQDFPGLILNQAGIYAAIAISSITSTTCTLTLNLSTAGSGSTTGYLILASAV